MKTVALTLRLPSASDGNRMSMTGPSQDPLAGLTQYAYDGKQRMSKVTLPSSQVIIYGMDYQNHRVSRSTTYNGQPDNRNYLYNGNQVVETIKNGQREALYGYDGQGLTSRIDANGNSTFYLWDGLGSAMSVIDGLGNIVQSYEYSAYGELLNGKDGVNPFRFVGRYSGQQDDATGLTYFWNRWYDSSVGRWINEDPIRFDSGDSNFFNYVLNGPAILTDPEGLVLAEYSISGETLSWVRTGGNQQHIAKNVISGSDLNSGKPWLTPFPDGPIPIGYWGFEIPGMSTGNKRRVMLYRWPGTQNMGRGTSIATGHLEFHAKAGPGSSTGCIALDQDDLTILLKDIRADGGGRVYVGW